jgi:Ca2+-binding RTX toxin-like protein
MLRPSTSPGRRRILLAALLAVGLLAVPIEPAAAAPPANDHFGNARVLTGRVGDTTGRTTEATVQGGEPSYSPPINSIWFSWVAPQHGSVAFDTCGSNFDTTLTVFRGQSVGALTQVVTDDDRDVARDGCSASTSRVEFGVLRNFRYRIQVDGFNASTGSVRLEWAMTRCAGRFVTIDREYTNRSATDGPDVIIGHDNGNALYGGPGDDTICGGTDGDAIYGQGGRDRLYGFGGGDALYAGPGGGITHGGPGNDGVYGGLGTDQLFGGPGLDALYGYDGPDALDGGPEADSCYGGSARDTGTGCENSYTIP